MTTVSPLDIKSMQKSLNKELCKLVDNRVYGMNCKASRYNIGRLGLALHVLDCPDGLSQEAVDCITAQFRGAHYNEELLAGSSTAALLSGSSSPVLAKPQIKSRNIVIERDANGLISSVNYGTVQKTISRDANLSIVQMKITTS